MVVTTKDAQASAELLMQQLFVIARRLGLFTEMLVAVEVTTAVVVELEAQVLGTLAEMESLS